MDEQNNEGTHIEDSRTLQDFESLSEDSAASSVNAIGHLWELSLDSHESWELTMTHYRAHSQLCGTEERLTKQLRTVSYNDFLDAFNSSKVPQKSVFSGEFLTHRQKDLSLITTPADAKKPLPLYGANPCTAFCSACDNEVHTRLELLNNSFFSRQILSALGSLCCRASRWLDDLRVHRCPHCRNVLARV